MAASEAHTTDYFIYVATVLEGEVYGHPLRKKVRELASSNLPQGEKHATLIGLVREQVETWREEVKQLDCALWARHVRAYQIFPRTFNLDGFRQVHGITPPERDQKAGFFQSITGADLDVVRGLGFSALRMMGVFPIGATNAKGTAGGSPYSIIAHDIDPVHGSRSDATRAFALGHERGILSIFEVVPNHTSCDSALLQTNPHFFVHTREYVISEICDLIRNYNLDGIRVDSAYQLLNEYLEQNWGATTQRCRARIPTRFEPRYNGRSFCRGKSEAPTSSHSSDIRIFRRLKGCSVTNGCTALRF